MTPFRYVKIFQSRFQRSDSVDKSEVIDWWQCDAYKCINIRDCRENGIAGIVISRVDPCWWPCDEWYNIYWTTWDSPIFDKMWSCHRHLISWCLSPAASICLRTWSFKIWRWWSTSKCFRWVSPALDKSASLCRVTEFLLCPSSKKVAKDANEPFWRVSAVCSSKASCR